MTAQTLSDEQLSVVWVPGKHDPEWKIAYLVRLREICKSSDNGIGEWLCGQRSLRRFSVKEMRALEAQLDSTTLRNALRDVTFKARRFNPSLPVARFAIEVERAPNPINPEVYTAENLSASRELVDALELAIRRDLEGLSSHARVGLLLLSGAYYGGLLDIPQLNALTQLDLSRVVWISGIPEARLRLSIRGQPDAEQRQWFPDPVTLALLSRCASDLADLRLELAQRDSKLRCIRDALLAVGMPAQNQPRSLESLFELLRIQLQIHMPQLLVNYSTRSNFVTHSVQLGSWSLLQGHSAPSDWEDRGSKKKHRHHRVEAEGPEWLKALCRKARNKGLEAVEHILPPGDIEGLISRWAACLLHGRSFYGNPLQPKTVANYVRDVGRGLVDHLSVESILEVHPDALEDIYELMLEAQPTQATRRNLAKGLLEFHGFLQQEFAYPPISPYAVLGIGKTPQVVDAQIITEDQYRLVLRDLAVGPLVQRSPRLVVVAQIMVIFGFRLGLRRSEALKLLRRDLQFPTISAERAAAVRKRHPNALQLSPDRLKALELPVNLHIRPHSQRTLKTRNSTRTLPLHVLLEPDELKLIEDFARQRDVEEAKTPYSDYLLCVPKLQTRWASESSLLPAIHDALRRVTGCGELHYHHLRHSFATWLTFKLAASAWGVRTHTDVLFGEHPQTLTWLRDNGRLERAFFHSQGAATRKVTHITSALLGHASPKTSLLHYVHCMPWLAALCWQWNPARWPPGHVVAKIAQVSLPTKPEDEHATGLPAETLHMQRIIGRIRAYKRGSQLKVKRPLSRLQKCDEGWALTRMTEISSMLAYQAYAESGQAVNMEWIEFSEVDQLGMLERAKYISRLGKHRLQGPVSDDQHDPVELIPRPPKHGGVAGVAVYAERLYRLLDSRHKAKACRVVDDFVERCWVSDTTLRFYIGEDKQSAREYLWLLSELGIPVVDTEFIIYDTRTSRQTKSRWRTVLGKPRLKIIEQVPENQSTRNSHVGIRVTLRLPGGELTAQEQNHHSGAALRYLMLMASIDWHFRA